MPAQQCRISEEERAEIVEIIARHPMAGDEIAGTGGVRKVRVARKGQGKSGGYRVITFFSGTDIPVFLLSVFAKNEKSNLSQSEKNTLRKILGQMVKLYKEGRKNRHD